MRLLNFQDFNKLQDLNSIYESTREEVMSLLEAEETLMDAGIFASLFIINFKESN